MTKSKQEYKVISIRLSPEDYNKLQTALQKLKINFMQWIRIKFDIPKKKRSSRSREKIDSSEKSPGEM